MKILSLIAAHKIVTAAILVGIAGSTAGAVVIAENSKPVEAEVSSVESVDKAPANNEATEPEATPEPSQEVAVVNTPVASPTPTPAPVKPTQDQVTPKEQQNPYGEGSQLWYVYNKRSEAGRSVGAWGDVNTWASAARHSGAEVNLDNPRQGDAMVYANQIFFIESVDGESFTSSYMINGARQTITFPKTDVAQGKFVFIH